MAQNVSLTRLGHALLDRAPDGLAFSLKDATVLEAKHGLSERTVVGQCPAGCLGVRAGVNTEAKAVDTGVTPL